MLVTFNTNSVKKSSQLSCVGVNAPCWFLSMLMSEMHVDVKDLSDPTQKIKKIVRNEENASMNSLSK
jgi:hypothetical protein